MKLFKMAGRSYGATAMIIQFSRADIPGVGIFLIMCAALLNLARVLWS